MTEPNSWLQLRIQAPIASVSTEEKSSIVVQHRVGAAPDDDGPAVVLRDPHPLPVLDLRDQRGLGLGVVVSQHARVGPVNHGDCHQQVTLRLTRYRKSWQWQWLIQYSCRYLIFKVFADI